MEKKSAHGGKEAEHILTEVVANLRNHPKKYQAFRKSLKRAKTNEEVTKELIDFATNEKELAALIPSRARGVSPGLASWTITVTVITFVSHD